ncbi:MAG: helix-turn-helix domain-containing protein [Solirubrobacterales bacterium]
MAPLERPDDNELLTALRHPLRRRILGLMADGEPTSPRQLAAALRQPLSNVSYHVRILAERSAINLVETRPSRGSVEHLYRSSIEASWARQILGLGEKDDGASGEGPGSSAT